MSNNYRNIERGNPCGILAPSSSVLRNGIKDVPGREKIYFKDRRVMHNLYPERGTRARRGALVMLLL